MILPWVKRVNILIWQDVDAINNNKLLFYDFVIYKQWPILEGEKKHDSQMNITLRFFVFCQCWSKQESITFSSLQRNLTIVICKSIPNLL